MPTLFDEPIPPNLVSNHLSQHFSALPLHSDQVELEHFLRISNYRESNTHTREDPLYKTNEQVNEDAQLLPRQSSSSPPKEEATQSTCSASLPSSPVASESDQLQMGRRKQSPRTERAGTPTSKVSAGQNGKANGDMNSQIEMRRKNPSLESPTAASQTAHLMGRESFSLDNELPPTPMTPNPNTSFFELPRQDRRNFLLLVLLYFLQGIPMGLASGSVPFLLKSHLSYGQIGVFSLASYPYSLKLLWSPIVDAIWSPVIGRRKSWILPIQMCSGFGMLYLGTRIKDMMAAAGASDGSGVWTFTWWWFFLVFLCATQDIAVDGE